MSEILNPASSAQKKINIVLVGSPNSGKTTLYNWLTGSKHKTVNYPGATIEFSKGELKSDLKDKFKTANFDQYFIFDTPGVYSLSAKSADEEVTLKILTEQKSVLFFWEHQSYFRNLVSMHSYPFHYICAG